MLEHELRVKLKKSGKELIVSQKYYAANADLYEVLEGEVAEIVPTKTFELPVVPDTKLGKPKSDKKEVAPVEAVKAPVKPAVEAPQL